MTTMEFSMELHLKLAMQSKKTLFAIFIITLFTMYQYSTKFENDLGGNTRLLIFSFMNDNNLTLTLTVCIDVTNVVTCEMFLRNFIK